MPGLVLRLWVLSLAVLFQASSWSSEACSSANMAFAPFPSHTETDAGREDSRENDARESGAKDRDLPEDSTEELSAVDDWSGNDVVAADVPKWCTPRASDRGYVWADGLPPGGPPRDTPFKPPRA